MNSPITTLLDRAALRRMAGGRSFERGEQYFGSGQVGALVEHEGTIVAKVQGARPYRVKLWVERGHLDYSCTCPVGTDRAFCKHCVAVGLTWLEQGKSAKTTGKKPAGPAVTMDDIRAHLAAQDKNALVELVMKQAMEDDRLRQRLLMQAAKKGPKGLDLATYRAALDDAIGIDEFVAYDDMHDYAKRIEEAITSVAELLDEGHAAEVLELAEHALEAVEDAIGSVDDSGGELGGIIQQLQDLHLRACRKAKPDPEELAGRLFEWELRADQDTFSGAAATYAGVLGRKGLAVYRELAEAEWAKVPALGSGQDDPEKYGKRYRNTHIMETMARQTGNVEALVEVKQRDLSSAYACLQIADTCNKARKHRRKRHDDAMALSWAEFAAAPGLPRYEKLKAHADRLPPAAAAQAGVVPWQAWREKALAVLRETIAKARRVRDGGQGRAGDLRRGAAAHAGAVLGVGDVRRGARRSSRCRRRRQGDGDGTRHRPQARHQAGRPLPLEQEALDGDGVAFADADAGRQAGPDPGHDGLDGLRRGRPHDAGHLVGHPVAPGPAAGHVQADNIRAKASTLVPSNGRVKVFHYALLTADRAGPYTAVLYKAAGMKDSWCLATSLPTTDGRSVVDAYAHRFECEEGFRDAKDRRFGMGLKQTSISKPDRRDQMLLLFALAYLILTLVGYASEHVGADRALRANTGRTRTHSLFCQGRQWLNGAAPARLLSALLDRVGRLVSELLSHGVAHAFG
ncbi:MAG: hypothetical protein HY905_24485 [Deltaproteobacteria bacterium]|nr:hypothetical protein [Deltaproteobacteria bacterium]